MRSWGRVNGVQFALLALPFLLFALPPAPGVAQTWTAHPHFDEDRNTVRDELIVFGANAAVGGLTAGIRQRRADGSFLDGFWRGALGGTATYAGKRIAVREGFGAGIVGRTVAAGGASVTRNASEGRPSFERMVLPVGPLRVRWWPQEAEWHATLDLAAVGSIAWAYLGGMGAVLDPVRTLGTGAPVFLAHRWEPEWGWHGRHAYGTIVLRGDGGQALGAAVPGGHEELMRRALAHERVHLLQYDQAYILWSEPIERGLARRLGLPEGFLRTVDFSLHAPVFAGLGRLLPHDKQPWEFEADALADTFLYRERETWGSWGFGIVTSAPR